jgi:predicted DNA binding CopG/RHH family protein
MKSAINDRYEDAPVEIERSLDEIARRGEFMPVDDLIGKVNKRRVTITLSVRSIERFKKFAKRHNAKYQTMISEVIDSYSTRL